jgi:hypothetical protein
MKQRKAFLAAVFGLLLGFPTHRIWAGAQVTVPAGTKVSEIKYGDANGTVVHFKPAEQVAFLFVYAIKDLESNNCMNTFFGGTGQPCTLSDLVKGVRNKQGQVFGLNTNPAEDTNYHYSVTIIGKDCIIKAIPRHPGLGGFAWVGSPGGMGNGDFYYNPNGADLAKAKELGEIGYSGKGFKR